MQPRTERVVSIDIIRGFALLGIFFINVPVMQNVMLFDPRNDFERIIQLFYNMFIETKFYVVFSFLFGVSAYYFMRSQEMKGLAHRQLFVKRALWLFAFGAVHYIFIWSGDILHNYARLGLLLPLFYKLSPKKILLTASLFMFVSFSVTYLPYILPINPSEEAVPMEMTDNIEGDGITKDITHWVNEENNQDYWSTVKQNAQSLIGSFKSFVIYDMELWSIALFGLGLAKSKFFEEFARHKKGARKLAIVSLLFALPFMVFMVKDFMDGMLLANPFYVWMSGKLLAIVYVVLFLFACEHARLRQKLAPLGAYGKMAFTNYLSQSIITIFIVMPFIEDFTLTMQFVYCIVFLTIQVWLSSILLKKYKYGPFEWLWRWLVFKGK